MPSSHHGRSEKQTPKKLPKLEGGRPESKREGESREREREER